MKQRISRKAFLSTTAMASGALLMKPITSFGIPFWKEDIRLGIIGTGNRGGGIAHLLKDLQGIKVMACCDILPDRLASGMKWAATGAKSYTDYRQLLESKELDAVLIATPLHLHYPMATAAIAAGKHVYLEKTMTYSIDEALQLTEQLKNSRLIFQVGHQNRYFSLYHRIKEIMSQNWLGKITHFECQYHRNSNWRVPVPDPSLERALNWRMYKQYSGGLLAELSAHQIDMVNWLLDACPVKVTGMGDINYWKDGRETYDNIRCIYEYASGIKLSASSILSNAYKGFSIRVLGDKATLEIQRDKAFLYAEEVQKETGLVDGVTGATKTNWTQGEAVPLNFKDQDNKHRSPTEYALLDFADRIRQGGTPLSNVISGKDTAICVHLGNKAMENEVVERWKERYAKH